MSIEPRFNSEAVVRVVTEHAQHWDADEERFYWAKRLAAYTEWEREGWGRGSEDAT